MLITKNNTGDKMTHNDFCNNNESIVQKLTPDILLDDDNHMIRPKINRYTKTHKVSHSFNTCNTTQCSKNNIVNEFIITQMSFCSNLYKIINLMIIDFSYLSSEEIESIKKITLNIKNAITHDVVFNMCDVSYDVFKTLNFSFVTSFGYSVSMYLPFISVENYISVEIHTTKKLKNKILLDVDCICIMDEIELYSSAIRDFEQLINRYESHNFKLTKDYNTISIPFNGSIKSITIKHKNCHDLHRLNMFGRIIFDDKNVHNFNKYINREYDNTYIIELNVALQEKSQPHGHFIVEKNISFELMTNEDSYVDITIVSYAVLTYEINHNSATRLKFNDMISGLLNGERINLNT
jgi:hypothetical protein